MPQHLRRAGAERAVIQEDDVGVERPELGEVGHASLSSPRGAGRRECSTPPLTRTIGTGNVVRSMEIGFFFWPYDVALVSALAEAADGFGYDMVGVADTPGNAMDPWVAATLVASRTRRARIALCVTNLVTRHPAATAAAIASLNLVAPGRAILGIGVGHSGTRNLGAPSLAPEELAGGVDFIKRLLRAEPATYRGAPAHLPWVKTPSPVF